MGNRPPLGHAPKENDDTLAGHTTAPSRVSWLCSRILS